MKKKEAIAEIAFLGISPDLQTTGEVEMEGGLIMQPMTKGNTVLACADFIKTSMENALAQIHDDTELTPEDFLTLEEALASFRDMVLSSVFTPEVAVKTERDFQNRIDHLRKLANPE